MARSDGEAGIVITCIACDRQFETKHAAARHWEQHDLNARLVRLEGEHATLRAALAGLVQAADRLATDEHYSIPSFVCGAELAAARAALHAVTTPAAPGAVAPPELPPIAEERIARMLEGLTPPEDDG